MRSSSIVRLAVAVLSVAVVAMPLTAQRGGAPRSSPSIGGGAAGGSRGAPSMGGGSAPRSSGGGFSGGSPRSSAPSPSFGGSRGGAVGGSVTRPDSTPRSAPSMSSGGRSSGGYPSRSPSISPRSSNSPSYPSRGAAPSAGSRNAGGNASGTAAPRYAPYGTNSGPSLYRGDSGGRAAGGGLSASGRGFAGAPAASGRGGANAPAGSRSSAGNVGSPSARGGSGEAAAPAARGFRGFGADAGRSTGTASDYRSALANRVGRGGAPTSGAGAGRTAVPPTSNGGGRGVVSPSYAMGGGATAGRSGYAGRAGYDSTYHNEHHHHYRHDDDRVHFSFFAGFGGFGFGYYHGWGGWYHSYPAYYYPHYYVPVWYYPYWGYCYYPYYWSYSYFPYYRPYVYEPPVYVVERRYVYETVTVEGVDQSYRGKGYLPSTSDDPYVNPKDLPDTNPSESAPADSGSSDVKQSGDEQPLAPVEDAGTVNLGSLDQPFVQGVAVGQTADDAMAKGDELIKSQKIVEAAEAYRTAYQRAPDNSAAALRLSVALFRAGDYQLASWALVKGVGASEKAMLDHAVMLDDLLGGKYVSEATRALEKSLIKRPNDESSNLLLGATYVMTGRTYAGYVILTRLKAAGYEPATTDVYLKQAEAALKN